MYGLNFKDMATPAFSLISIIIAFIMLFRTKPGQLIPHQLRSYLYSLLHHLYAPRSSELTLIIKKLSGSHGYGNGYGMPFNNKVYEAADVYLQTKISPLNERLTVSKTSGQEDLTIAIDTGEEIIDTFDNNITLKWRYVCTARERGGEKHQFELKFLKKHRAKVMDSYLPYVLARADALC
ncbi:hypothetical protein M0R45_004118 [Rubus argutus]|uniref:AAA-type ATPase N-terminal domain-containing protein n=1 Tax=Rubus argutus TaxID=59490 RepID=A0AAW1YIV7_RUBAR